MVVVVEEGFSDLCSSQQLLLLNRRIYPSKLNPFLVEPLLIGAIPSFISIFCKSLSNLMILCIHLGFSTRFGPPTPAPVVISGRRRRFSFFLLVLVGFVIGFWPDCGFQKGFAHFLFFLLKEIVNYNVFLGCNEI